MLKRSNLKYTFDSQNSGVFLCSVKMLVDLRTKQKELVVLTERSVMLTGDLNEAILAAARNANNEAKDILTTKANSHKDTMANIHDATVLIDAIRACISHVLSAKMSGRD